MSFKTITKFSALALIAGLTVGCASTSDLAAVKEGCQTKPRPWREKRWIPPMPPTPAVRRTRKNSTACSRSRCTSKPNPWRL